MAGDPSPVRRITFSSVTFQSAPAIDGGRSGAPTGNKGATYVSIRARHRWRAIQEFFLYLRARRACFNPRPPSMAGDPT